MLEHNDYLTDVLDKGLRHNRQKRRIIRHGSLLVHAETSDRQRHDAKHGLLAMPQTMCRLSRRSRGKEFYLETVATLSCRPDTGEELVGRSALLIPRGEGGSQPYMPQ